MRKDVVFQALDGTPDASSTTDGRSDACITPGSSLNTRSPGDKRGPGQKKTHRRGTGPNPFRNTSQSGAGLPASTPTGPRVQWEGEKGGRRVVGRHSISWMTGGTRRL